MDWCPFFPAIYKAETLSLDPYQDGCYRRLIDHYMDTRRPLPRPVAAVTRNPGVAGCATSVGYAWLYQPSHSGPLNGAGQELAKAPQR